MCAGQVSRSNEISKNPPIGCIGAWAAPSLMIDLESQSRIKSIFANIPHILSHTSDSCCRGKFLVHLLGRMQRAKTKLRRLLYKLERLRWEVKLIIKPSRLPRMIQRLMRAGMDYPDEVSDQAYMLHCSINRSEIGKYQWSNWLRPVVYLCAEKGW